MLTVACDEHEGFPTLEGPYLGQTPPGTMPEKFAPGIISFDGRYEGGATFSPDGSKVLYTTYMQADPRGAWLVVRDVAGDDDHVLLKYEAPIGISQDQGLGLSWAANGRIHVLVNPLGVRGLLVQLGEE